MRRARDFLLSALLFALPRLAFAAAAGTTPPSEAPSPPKEGMPQLAFGNPLTLDQVYWGAAIFLISYLLMRYVGLPRVTDVLESREAKIRADLEAARGAKSAADNAARELMQTTADARAQAQASINAAVEQARAEAAKRNAELASKLDAQIAEAEQRIAGARHSAMGALRQVAGETASAILARLAGQDGDRAALDAAVQAELSARGLA